MSTTDHLQTWLDKLALTELVSILAAPVARGDRDRIIDCYAAESYDDHGAFRGAGEEFAGMICSANHSVADDDAPPTRAIGVRRHSRRSLGANPLASPRY